MILWKPPFRKVVLTMQPITRDQRRSGYDPSACHGAAFFCDLLGAERLTPHEYAPDKRICSSVPWQAAVSL